MKKTLAIIVSLVLVVASLFCLVACNNKETITIWVSETAGVKDTTIAQINKYIEANADAYDWKNVKFVVEGVTESDSASLMVADVENGPDVYCFAQDQLARLVEANALAELTGATADAVKSRNDEGSVKAGSVAGKLYSFPLTSDNGYFMYYDKSVIAESHIDDLASIVADCVAADKTFSFEVGGSAWYTASFFFATGCHSNWVTNEKGKFTSVDDTFNSAAGITALKGMQILTKSEAWNDSSKAADFNSTSAVVVSGTWDSVTAQTALGDNYGVADLPSFTVDGQTYHLGSFSGNKLMGVKPQTDAARVSALIGLADYLSGEACQLERFNSFGWGPSNLKAQQDPAVQTNPALVALGQQSAYATPQGQIHGSWWDIAKVLGTVSKNANSDEDLQNGLNKYDSDCDRVLKLTDEELAAYTIIGSVGGTMWDTDLKMTKTAGDTKSTETWRSEAAFELTETSEFKIRRGQSWDIAFGDNESNADTSVPLSNKANYKVATAGTYYIEIVVTYADGKPATAVISLIPA